MAQNRLRKGRAERKVQGQAGLTQVQSATIGGIANRPAIAGPSPLIGIHPADRPHITGGTIIIGVIIGGQCQEASSSRR